MEPDGSAPRDAQAFIAALDEVDRAHYRVCATQREVKMASLPIGTVTFLFTDIEGAV